MTGGTLDSNEDKAICSQVSSDESELIEYMYVIGKTVIIKFEEMDPKSTPISNPVTPLFIGYWILKWYTSVDIDAIIQKIDISEVD